MRRLALVAGVGAAWLIAFGDQIPAMLYDEVRFALRRWRS